MKKLFLVLTLAVMLMSCEKDEEYSAPEKCNCGTIANDGIDNINNQLKYWLEIRNSCSGNKKKFYFDQDIWMTAYVGTDICLNNVSSW